MLGRLARLALARYAGGPGRAALYLTILSGLRRRLRAPEAIDIQRLAPGETLLVEHLPITHRRQLKQLKREEKRARRAARAARKAGRRTAS